MNIEKPIVLSEFPKSGGSWIVSMIGDALGVPKRDIYVRTGFNLFDITRHPWYTGGQELDFPLQSVIKSHELPGSALIDFDATYVHLVRDGRDVIVSKWFFEKDFCVNNGITSSFDRTFDEYVEGVAHDWAKYILAWTSTGVMTTRYEDFLSDPVNALGIMLKRATGGDLSNGLLDEAVSKNTKENFSTALSKVFRHNTFVRKAVSGDWKRYFSNGNIECFNSVASDAMALLGYEK